MDLNKLWNQALLTFQDGSVLTVGLLVTAIFVLLVGLLVSSWISRLLGRRMTKSKLSPDTIAALQKLIFIFLAIATVLTTLSLLRVPLTAFTFLSGAVAIGVGFGAQNVINNFISGWILMSERPVRIGDFIEIDESRGVVERIGNRSTQIRRVDGVHIMVPNSLLMERTLINWTLVDKNIRTSISVGVAYGSPVQEVEKLIYEIIAEHKGILKQPAPVVVFSDFGDSALIFEALFWCEVSGERELRLIRSDLRFRIDELFRQRNISIAFPQRDVHLIADRPLEIISRPQGARDTGSSETTK
jgi:small-conductance mechanosensitive channel